MLCKSSTEQDALQSMPVLIACAVVGTAISCSKVADVIHKMSWRNSLKGGISFYAAVLLITAYSHECYTISNVMQLQLD